MKIVRQPQRFPVLIQYNVTVRTYNKVPFYGGSVRILQTVATWGKRTVFARWFAARMPTPARPTRNCSHGSTIGPASGSPP
jgi:hypothetical protein